MSAEYRDRWIECTDEDVVIRGYYFPWGVQALIRERAGLPATADDAAPAPLI